MFLLLQAPGHEITNMIRGGHSQISREDCRSSANCASSATKETGNTLSSFESQIFISGPRAQMCDGEPCSLQAEELHLEIV